MKAINERLGITGRLLPAAAMMLWLASTSLADPETFSLDGQSPSPVDPADLLNPGGPPPPTQVAAPTIGLVAGDDLDALSPGIDAVQHSNIVYFSVDRASVGVPGPLMPLDVFGQFLRFQQAGDVFVTTNPIGVASVPGGVNMLRDNQTFFGELPLIPATVQNATGRMDNLDALTFEEFDLDGDGIPEVPVYFSLSAGSPSLAGPLGPADILMAPPAGPYGLFAAAGRMGLAPDDDLDALALLDLGRPGVVDPGVDRALFSLAPGSPTLVAGGLSPADVFMTGFGGGSAVRYVAGSLGLARTDNLDALEVQVPEPATLSLLGLAWLAILGRQSRRRASV